MPLDTPSSVKLCDDTTSPVTAPLALIVQKHRSCLGHLHPVTTAALGPPGRAWRSHSGRGTGLRRQQVSEGTGL